MDRARVIHQCNRFRGGYTTTTDRARTLNRRTRATYVVTLVTDCDVATQSAIFCKEPRDELFSARLSRMEASQEWTLMNGKRAILV